MRLPALVISALMLFAPALRAAQSAPQSDPYSSDFEKSPPEPGIVARQWLEKEALETQAKHVLRVSIPEAVKPLPGAVGTDALSGRTATGEIPQNSPRQRMQDLYLAALLILSGILATQKLVPLLAEFLNARFDPWRPPAVASWAIPASVLAEEQTFAQFVAAFRIGPRGTSQLQNGQALCVPDRLTKFFKEAPKAVAALRSLLPQVRPDSEIAARKKHLSDFRAELRSLKELAGLPELLPVWQMTCAMDGLLGQLISKADNITLSTLRTVAQAVDLLEVLSRPGLRPDLASEPPIRLLGVDDDPISRHALSFALKQALNPPDLAQHAEAALPLINQHKYDVIFLDVQMPAMDGFELCSKIHQTEVNRTTPVVFVTCYSDFEARAKSTLVGGHDLMGKPFLTFEITVKALTLALRGRLEPTKVTSTIQPAHRVEAAKIPSEGKAAESKSIAEGPAAKQDGELLSRKKRRRNRQRRKAGITPTETKREPTSTPHGIPEGDLPPSVRTHAAPERPDHAVAVGMRQSGTANGSMRYFRDLLDSVTSGQEGDNREFLAQLCLGIHSLTCEVDRNGPSPAFRLSLALQGLLKKLIEKPGLATPSAIRTAGAALTLLDELRAIRTGPDLKDPAVRILVVDDDPVARRAITAAVQLSFAKPESADSGEGALKLASETPYDVIFLDVRMPGMDGFETCTKVRRTATNARTPIVFVSSDTELDSQKPCALSGSSAFIPKPALAAEVTLAALTHVIRNRLTGPALAPTLFPEATRCPKPGLEPAEVEAAC